MKFKLTNFLILISVLLGFSNSNAQISGPQFLVDVLGLYGFRESIPLRDLDFLGGGARARGMGGAFLALSDDASAASWNPAGLVQLNKMQTSFSLLTASLSNQYENSFSSFSFDKTRSNVNYAGFLLPFKLYNRNFVGSVIFNQASDLRDNYVIPVDTAGNYYRNDLDGKLNYVGMAVGGKLFSGISLGATVNIYGGSFTNNKYQIFAPYGTPPDDTLITAHPFNKATFSGVNVLTGFMYHKNKLRIAATGKTPLTLEETDDVQWLYDITVRGVTNPQSISRPGFLYKTVRKWKIPFSWGLGASYLVSDNLLLSADLETRYQRKVKLQYQINSFNPVSPFTEINLNDISLMDINDNTSQFRLGAEYVLPMALPGKLLLRGGYRNQPKVLNPVFEVRADSADAQPLFRGDYTKLKTNWLIRDGSLSGSTYSFGFGWARAQIKLDFAVEFNRWKIENSGFIFLDPWNNPADNYRYTETNNYNLTRYIFNFTGYF